MKQFAISLGSALALFAVSTAMAASAPPLVAAVMKAMPIFIRQEHDQRISAYLDEFDGEKTAHVYLSLSDQTTPYAFSLGWFVPTTGKEAAACLDEFGERIPAPGEKPERAAFNKADLAALQGFDLISSGKLKAAGKDFQTAIKQAPKSARMHNNLGAYYALLDEYGEAHKELDEAIKLKPDYAVALANRAWLALSMKQPELALHDAEKALGAHRDYRPAALAAARANLDLGRADQSVSIADQGGKGMPDPSAMLVAADALMAKGDVKGARQRYQKALLLAPRNPHVLVKASKVEEICGDLDAAMKYARAATQADPKNPEAHLILGHYLELDRQYKAAQLQYESAIDLNPPEALRNMAFGPLLRVLITQNRTQEADKLSKKWLAENTQNADCHYNRAWVASTIGGAEYKSEAILEYRKALLLNPELVQAHYNLALLLMNKGHPEDAVKELKVFIEKSPQDPDVANAKELLAKLTH